MDLINLDYVSTNYEGNYNNVNWRIHQKLSYKKRLRNFATPPASSISTRSMQSIYLAEVGRKWEPKPRYIPMFSAICLTGGVIVRFTLEAASSLPNL